MKYMAKRRMIRILGEIAENSKIIKEKLEAVKLMLLLKGWASPELAEEAREILRASRKRTNQGGPTANSEAAGEPPSKKAQGKGLSSKQLLARLREEIWAAAERESKLDGRSAN